MANEFVARRGIIAQSGGAKITGSLLVSGTVDATGYNIIASSFTGSFSGSIGTATTASYVSPSGLPAGTVSASSQIDYNAIQNKLSGVISSSAQFNALSGTSASYALTASFASNANIPAGTVSSSTQFKTLTDPFTGSFTGSFTGDGSGLTGIATVLNITGSTGTSTVNLKTQALTVNGGNGITTNASGQTITISAPAGTVSASSQIDYNSIQNKLSGVVSSSTQVAPLLPGGTVSSSAQYPGWVTASSQIDITSTTGYSTFSSSIATKNDLQDVSISALNNATGSYATTASNSFTGVQTITNTTNSTNYTSGALVVQGGVGITKDVNISGSLTVTGLLTAVSTSIQYVTSSQLNIGVSRVTVNDDDLVRFAGLSVIDSGSTYGTGSLLWDSLNNRWIYEADDLAYNSAVIIAGPKNTGALGGEVGLTDHRVPVAHGDDHIDSRPESSSIRVDFPSRLTHIESGLYITGSVTSSVGFKGDGSQLTGIVTTLTITGSDASTDSVDLKTSGLTFAGGNGITTTVANDTVTISAPLGTVSSSGQVKNLLPTDTVSSSTQVVGFLPGGTVSSSAQYPGWVTASSQILLNSITGATFSNQAFLFPQDVTLTGDLTVAGNDIKNNNGTAVITFAGTSNNDVRLWSGGALDVQSGEIRNNGTTAIQMSGQNVQIINSGSMNAAKINNTYYSGSTPTAIIGPVSNQVVATLKAADFDAAHFDYVVKDGTNYRTGVVMAVWDGSNVEFTDTSTNDIGNTAGVSFAVDISSGNVRLKITTDTGTWTLKTTIRAL